ncbi:helix-turn-helix domain-containing protein [Acinetobacter ursingii]|uniref:helix-turn-helix domain-containing protein n=1 Tax=Acinetobacter ursingii TaxID=108980 RepID=UPI00124F9608|nr:helix-turn-helix transcriptional regulator [Acinetobacter ursingii]MCU4304791.1 helix-turn-helix domain-containing protein [Acinetobacter ursingii]MCU4370796.1 helix-turn-helix domain-containing protein [Acinetobacter ursingii]MDG9991752.1 helix-turn-helix domain-containing protein [Acinetobacter ursingii]MDH0205355.1 helix-turn-helix domain-containing protein [Acinetobacter ursingii]
MNDLPNQIGLLIRKQRSDKKISQEKLALLCNIDRSYLGRIERGEVNITVIKLYEIASVLNTNPKDLIPDL